MLKCKNAEMQLCMQAKRQKCRVASVRACTIGLGSAVTKMILSSRIQATKRASLEFRQATKDFRW